MAHTCIDILRAFGRLAAGERGMLPDIPHRDCLQARAVPDLVIADLCSLWELAHGNQVTLMGADIGLYYTDTARRLARGSHTQAPLRSRERYSLECRARGRGRHGPPRRLKIPSIDSGLTLGRPAKSIDFNAADAYKGERRSARGNRLTLTHKGVAP
jgi:hypothetical protein